MSEPEVTNDPLTLKLRQIVTESWAAAEQLSMNTSTTRVDVRAEIERTVKAIFSTLTAAESVRPADTSGGVGVEPRNWMLINRKEAADLMKKAAEEHADMALNGEPDRASNRESAEAAFTSARYILAFMPAADGTTVENAVPSLPEPTSPASLADGLAEALEWARAFTALSAYRTARDGGKA